MSMKEATGVRYDGAMPRVSQTKAALAAEAWRAIFDFIVATAPQRNRIKRRLREGLRLAQRSGCFEAEGGGRSTATVGLDIGIFPSSAVLAMNFDALMVQLCSGVAELMRKRGRLPI